MTEKLSAAQLRRIDEIQQFQRSVQLIKKWVGELDSNRAAKTSIISGITTTIARELSHLRQRALTSSVASLADVAGALSVLASRTGGLQVKIRGLQEGVTSMEMQLDQALNMARKPPTPT